MNRFVFLLASIVAPFLGGTAYAHPFHACLAEMKWSEKDSGYQVALKVDPNDLEEAVAFHSKNNNFKLDESEAVGKAIFAYLKTRFVATQPDKTSNEKKKSGNALPLKWVGHEADVKEAWLYFEIPIKTDPSQLSLKNTILLEINERQVNLVTVIRGKQKKSYHFSKEKSKVTIEN